MPIGVDLDGEWAGVDTGSKAGNGSMGDRALIGDRTTSQAGASVDLSDSAHAGTSFSKECEVFGCKIAVLACSSAWQGERRAIEDKRRLDADNLLRLGSRYELAACSHRNGKGYRTIGS